MPDITPALSATHVFPSLARFRGGAQNYFVICDPAALRAGERLTYDECVDANQPGRMTAEVLATGVLFIFLAVVPMTIFGEWEPLGFVFSFVFGIMVGLIVVTLRYRMKGNAATRRTADRIERVDRASSQAWRLCETAEKISETVAFSKRLVDLERLIAGLLWRSVRTSLELATLQQDVERASKHPSLAELVAERRHQLDATKALLADMERRLQTILVLANTLDDRVRDRLHDAELKKEEAMLREKLTGQTQSFLLPSEDETTAATIQFEADALNELVVESDRILSRFNQALQSGP